MRTGTERNLVLFFENDLRSHLCARHDKTVVSSASMDGRITAVQRPAVKRVSVSCVRRNDQLYLFTLFGFGSAALNRRRTLAFGGDRDGILGIILLEKTLNGHIFRRHGKTKCSACSRIRKTIDIAGIRLAALAGNGIAVIYIAVVRIGLNIHPNFMPWIILFIECVTKTDRAACSLRKGDRIGAGIFIAKIDLYILCRHIEDQFAVLIFHQLILHTINVRRFDTVTADDIILTGISNNHDLVILRKGSSFSMLIKDCCGTGPILILMNNFQIVHLIVHLKCSSRNNRHVACHQRQYEQPGQHFGQSLLEHDISSLMWNGNGVPNAVGKYGMFPAVLLPERLRRLCR